MSFFFGRRHSFSGAPPEGDGVPRHPNLRLRRRASLPNVPTQNHDRNMFQDLFRRHRDPPGTEPTVVEKDHDTSHANSPERSKAKSAKGQAASPKLSKAHESHVKENEKKSEHVSKHDPSGGCQLSKDDVETLFSGAPYFLLEKGKYGHFYPQVIFPFDDHDPTIQNLWDRRPLPHPSYTLCTLHAHLPVPDRWVTSKDTPIHLNGWRRAGAPKRATFDIGIFEVPNMLAMNGRDPGAVGLRHFLELPVADAVRYPEKPKARFDYLQLSSMPASEVFELMEHYHDTDILIAGNTYDRKQLLCDGPSGWKKIGVRDINLQSLVERLRVLTDLRREMLHGNRATTILDTESSRDLYSGLFTKFLYPPPRSLLTDVGETHSLQAQIKALIVTLATRGAWVDFSLPEWRLYAGQLLWEASPHSDGDLLDPSTCQKPWMHPTLERRWFLIQMLLAAELLLRLDATVRVGILDNSRELHITQKDVTDFEKLRSGKVDWDLVAVRRFMDTFSISYNAEEPDPLTIDSHIQTHLKGESNHEKNHRSFFGSLLHRSLSSSSNETVESAWKCSLLPNFLDQQLQGLLAFAEEIGWPGFNKLKARLNSTVGAGQMSEAIIDAYNNPVRNALPTEAGAPLNKEEMHSRSPSHRRILLQCSQDQADTVQLGGWITRSWLSGFVFPGEQISHLLMATILENDPDAMDELGPIANLYGGFAYNGKTWWSKECVVGRVLASMEDTKECLGWLRSDIVPSDAWTVQSLDNTWFEVTVQPPLTIPGKPRIKQGHKLSLESTPLGLGDLASGAFSLPLDTPLEKEPKIKISFEGLTFCGKDGQPLENTPHLLADRATMSFTIVSETDSHTKVAFPLRHNVRFITSHECRPPANFISYHCTCPTGSGTSTPSSSSSSFRHHRLPGHPLHSTYAFKHVSLESLPNCHVPDSDFLEGGYHQKYEVLIVDARGGHEKETFARAWCASAGYNAIIGRVGRTCLACCIREARAISVKVVLRVDGCVSRASSAQTLPGF